MPGRSAIPRIPCATPRERRPCGGADLSATLLPAWPVFPCRYLAVAADDRIPSPAADNLGKTAVFEDREHQNGDTVLARQRDRRCIHYLEIAREDIEIVEPFEPLGAGHAVRIGVVDAVDLGRLEERVAAHFGGAQRRRRIGR